MTMTSKVSHVHIGCREEEAKNHRQTTGEYWTSIHVLTVSEIPPSQLQQEWH